jgi:hypothetical protein
VRGSTYRISVVFLVSIVIAKGEHIFFDIDVKGGEKLSLVV